MIIEDKKIDVYLDTAMTKEALEIFKKYGMGLSDAFNAFLSQSVKEKAIPFEVNIPNDETVAVIEDARNGKNMTKLSLEALKKVISA